MHISIVADEEEGEGEGQNGEGEEDEEEGEDASSNQARTTLLILWTLQLTPMPLAALGVEAWATTRA